MLENVRTIADIVSIIGAFAWFLVGLIIKNKLQQVDLTLEKNKAEILLASEHTRGTISIHIAEDRIRFQNIEDALSDIKSHLHK